MRGCVQGEASLARHENIIFAVTTFHSLVVAATLKQRFTLWWLQRSWSVLEWSRMLIGRRQQRTDLKRRVQTIPSHWESHLNDGLDVATQIGVDGFNAGCGLGDSLSSRFDKASCINTPSCLGMQVQRWVFWQWRELHDLSKRHFQTKYQQCRLHWDELTCYYIILLRWGYFHI